MMAFPALLSELYEIVRRKVVTDERPTRVVAEAAVIEDARFHSIDKKFDALSHTMDQRFDALSQRFVVLNEPSDGLCRVLDQRFYALNQAMDQRFGTFGHQISQRLHADMAQRFGTFGPQISQRLDAAMGQRVHAMDERFGTFGREMGQRFDALGRMIDDRFARVDEHFVARDVRFGSLETKTASIAAMDVWLERLETKIATEFRYLRWGLGIVIALVLGLVTKVILDWLDSPILSLFGRAINAIHF
jgi:RNase H-fold protein (predicted Holliday junction resolvase)